MLIDNLKVHHSKVVKEWAGKNQGKIALFFLPSYSPKITPDEYLNCDSKQRQSAKKSPKNKEILQSNVEQHMELLTNNLERMKKYFKHKSIQYAA